MPRKGGVAGVWPENFFKCSEIDCDESCLFVTGLKPIELNGFSG